jgi:hypothetical protein
VAATFWLAVLMISTSTASLRVNDAMLIMGYDGNIEFTDACVYGSYVHHSTINGTDDWGALEIAIHGAPSTVSTMQADENGLFQFELSDPSFVGRVVLTATTPDGRVVAKKTVDVGAYIYAVYT